MERNMNAMNFTFKAITCMVVTAIINGWGVKMLRLSVFRIIDKLGELGDKYGQGKDTIVISGDLSKLI